MSTKLPEILVPAGNEESLKAAIFGGADAVYLGLKDFSARAKAANFSLEELRGAITYAHLFGVKVHVAVNTLIKDSEMDSAIEQIDAAAKAGADAFIIQDLGLMQNIRGSIDVPLHASTQMGIHNVYGAEFAKKLGFDRVILSRESTLDDIRDIKNNVDIEVETFVQGALCVAFSGNCLFSSLVSGYSGNRGKCLQLCRKKYTLDFGGRKSFGYNLSAKDLCLLPDLKELCDAGVDSFKIEGRMRRAEYAGECAAVYRTAVDALDDCGGNSIEESIDRLKRVFNRGDYCRGYLHAPTADVIYPLIQGHKGVKIGVVDKVAGKSLVLRADRKVRCGDGLKFIDKFGETGGCLISDPKNIVFEGSVKRGDEVYLTTDSEQAEQIKGRESKLRLSYTIVLRKNQPLKAIISCLGIKKTVISDFTAREARTAPINADTVVDIFSKGAAKYFQIERVDAVVDDNVFVTIGQLKEFRRRAEREITAAVTESNYVFKARTNYGNMPSPLLNIKQDFDLPKTILRFDSEEFFDEFSTDERIDAFIYSPTDYSDLESIQRLISNSRKLVFLNTPIMARHKDLDIMRRIAESGIENIVADNLYATELFSDKNILLGDGLNLLNKYVEKEKIASYERDVMSRKDYLTVFGQVPIMTYAHCPYKNSNGSCPKDCDGYEGKLVDERNNVFRLRRYKVAYCYAQLKNDTPLFLEEEARKKNVIKRIYDFRGYSATFAKKLLDDIFSDDIPEFKHTHFNYNKTLR